MAKPNSKTDLKLVMPIAGAIVVVMVSMHLFIIFLSHDARNAVVRRESELVRINFANALDLVAADVSRVIVAPESPPRRVGMPVKRIVGFDAEGRLLEPAAPGAAALNRTVGELKPIADRAGYAADIVWIEGRPMLAVVARAPDRSVKVGLLTLDGGALNNFASTQKLDEARLLVAAEPDRKLNDAVFRTSTPVGVKDRPARAVLQWSTVTTMESIVNQRMPLTWLLSLLVLAVGYPVYRRTRRLAQSLVASEEHAQHVALHDAMTGLANRLLFSSRLDLALEQRRRSGGVVGVFVVDLDRFKQVNDSLGHAAGDELIREASRRLLSVCRTTDTVARLGGDELALVAHMPSAAAIEILARRTVERLSGEVELPGGRARLSASVGVTVLADETADSAEALRQADLALYRAKDQGRGRFAMFELAMDESLRLRRKTEEALHRAIAEDRIEVHYQPQFTVRGGKLESVEALARWNDPEQGMISPAYFIPIAEESGLIHDLGEMVLRKACRDAARWGQLKVAVNVSPLQLRRGDFAAVCRRVLAEAGVEASRIELEITESVMLDNDQRTQVALRELRDMGFKLALDDFGTGYSSLSYLNVYPVDKIKIDRSFISALGVQEDADKVVKAIVKLGRALGLQVTAEGVETEAQRAELVAAGCSVLQGYLEARPGDPSTIDALLAAARSSKSAA